MDFICKEFNSMNAWTQCVLMVDCGFEYFCDFFLNCFGVNLSYHNLIHSENYIRNTNILAEGKQNTETINQDWLVLNVLDHWIYVIIDLSE